MKVCRVYLTDAAQKDRYDLSLLLVMKEGVTFYEKYGYVPCDVLAQIDHHPCVNAVCLHTYCVNKRLLRNFRFDVFLLLLEKKDKVFVDNVLSTLRRFDVETSFTTYGEFYSSAFETLNRNAIFEEYKILFLGMEDILCSEKYPWFSMVIGIQRDLTCYEKIFFTK